MSWRLLTRMMFDRPRETAELARTLNADPKAVDRWLREARTLGAIESTEIGRHRITLMGIAMIEGRVELKSLRPGGHAWCATWMQPLPRYRAKPPESPGR